MRHMVFTSGPKNGMRFDIPRDLDVGRSSSCGVPIDDRTVSRRHALLSIKEDGLYMADLNSQNGTRVNGQFIKAPTLLKDKDAIQFGEVQAVFHDAAAPKPERTSSIMLIERPDAVRHAIKAEDAAASLVSGNLTVEELKRRVRLLQDVSIAVNQSLDEPALLALVLKKLFEVFPFADRAFILLYDAEKDDVTPGAVLTRQEQGEESVTISRTLVWDVIKNRRGIVSLDAMTDSRFKESKSVILLGIRSIVCVPMIADDVVYGVIALDSLENCGAFGPSEMALLVGIAAQAALALSRARLHRSLVDQEIMDRDLVLAHKIQARFLPQGEPEFEGWDLQAFYRSAYEVGGDFYDFLEIPDGNVAIVIGDVSGKGVSAALYMAKVMTEFRTRAVARTDPSDIMKNVNRYLIRDMETGMFVTALLAVVNLDSGLVRVANAGHLAPFVRRADGTVLEFELPRTSPLGINEATIFPVREYGLEHGEALVLYSDGISEATRKGGELFGEDRLVDCIARAAGSPESVLGKVLDAVAQFTQDEPQSDDMTLLCVGRAPVRGLQGTGRVPAVG